MSILKFFLKEKKINFLRTFFLSKLTKKTDNMDSNLRKKLIKLYKNDVQKLSDLLKKDLKKWTNESC